MGFFDSYNKFDYILKEHCYLFFFFLLADILLVGGYNLSSVNHLPNTLIKEVFVFID